MKRMKFVSMMGVATISIALLAGCGTTPSAGSATKTSPTTTTKTSVKKNQTYVIGGTPYQGQKNLQAWEKKAKASPKNVDDLSKAGVSAYLNGQSQLAIHYYELATQIQPSNGVLWNNIGNVYRNSLHNYQTAIQYYKKATTTDPKYDYGWYNWAYTLIQMKDVTAAKGVVANGLKVLPKSDPLYKYLGELVNPPKVATKK